MTSPARTYLRDIRAVRATGAGTAEISNYTPLTNLLNEVGRQRHVGTHCVQNLSGDAGHPDFGLFARHQLRKLDLKRPLGDGPPPERGVVEAKPPHRDVAEVARTRQVDDYWRAYGLVLVTNFRSFLVVGRGEQGEKVALERFDLAASAEEFWALAAHPTRLGKEREQSFLEFLTRVLLQNAPLARPKDVAWFLASYARDALARIEAAEGSLPHLAAVRETLEEALGISFEGEKGEHFFRSTLVQTLFYGLFSAWVLWCKERQAGRGPPPFRLEGAAWHLRLPVLRALFEQVSLPGALGPLNLKQVLDWAAATLRRVDGRAFFERFREDRAVQYFYEPFLHAFDPALRKQLGVWYTPPEVVHYMVERVDRVLRDELEIDGGLASERVYVLDPCCGTGSYLVQVLRRIEATLRQAHGDDALVAEDVKRAAMERVFGFEIMPAPFVVAHMQLGLLMENLGAPFETETPSNGDAVERAGVLLTNALTGWEDASEDQPHLPLPDFEREIERARTVKRESPILVVLGNPPYNSYAGVSESPEERSLTDFYRRVRRVRPPEGHGLNDLYARFYRMAERRIVEQTGSGVVCLISNYSWLDGLSFTGMRERYLEVFDRIWIDCLNGDKYKTGKLTPDGEPDPSIFSTEHNREGIGIGTAIGLLVRRTKGRSGSAEVRYRDLWGRTKWDQLIATKNTGGEDIYTKLSATPLLGLSFTPQHVQGYYLDWPYIADIFPYNSPGVKTSRDFYLVAIDFDELEAIICTYFNNELNDTEIKARLPYLMEKSRRYDPFETRRNLLNMGKDSGFFVKFSYRPFDTRHLYWHPETKLLDEKRETLFAASQFPNLFMTSRQKAERGREGTPFYITPHLPDWHLTRPGSGCFPLLTASGLSHEDLLSHNLTSIQKAQNLSRAAREYLALIGSFADAPAECSSEIVWMHVLAIGYSPAYLTENADGIRQDWPRIPLPASRERLEQSAALGRRVAALLDVERKVEGVDAPPVRPELKLLGVLRTTDGRSAGERHRRLRARWGYAGQHRVTMPGKGDARGRDYTAEERAAIESGAEALGLPPAAALACLGASTCDVYLNERAYWANVPARVWTFTIGGYQVIKKWLSYREYELLGRALTTEEARYVGAMTRRLAALLLLAPALDDNYRAVAAEPYPWPQTRNERA